MDAPENVGIRAMELYFPRIFVGQSDLEKFDRVSSGKYTIGLGQREMAFCADNEDIASICMTVLANLLERYEINISTVGFLAVGTETLIDKSKGVKTQLMELFGANTDIEGVDVKNACFGGTQALFHAVDWVYANWQTEKRYAIVVMGDIAIYEPGAARCTGGAGAFAALIGPDALIAFDRGLRASYMVNAWDFYKPISGVSKEFPVVNGPISLASYFKALDATYKAYRDKASRIRNSDVDISSFDVVMFHSPFCRHVQKAFARLCYWDYLNGASQHICEPARLKPFCSMQLEETYTNRDFISAALAASDSLFRTKVDPYLLFNRRIGNMYTPSLYAQLVALFHRSSSLESILGQRLLFFSYGSGAASAMFSATICNSGENDSARTQYRLMKESADAAAARLESRICVPPEEYTQILQMRERLITSDVPYTPEILNGSDKADGMCLFPCTFYLTSIDAKYRRFYSRFADV
uniref:Hydroxymethylglutaryl-CoA synthase n=2 Tax=Parascaris univalens TaxID=6257 RepID=A0A915BQD5_PARUN